MHCPRCLCLSCLVIRLCHRPGSFARDVVSVLVWDACFFLSGPVCRLAEHGAGMGNFCAFPVSGLHYGGSLCLLQHVFTVTGRSDSAGHLHALCVYATCLQHVCSPQLTHGDGRVNYNDHIYVLLV